MSMTNILQVTIKTGHRSLRFSRRKPIIEEVRSGRVIVLRLLCSACSSDRLASRSRIQKAFTFLRLRDCIICVFQRICVLNGDVRNKSPTKVQLIVFPYMKPTRNSFDGSLWIMISTLSALWLQIY